MEKTLTLIRHASAAAWQSNENDFSRKLAKKATKELEHLTLWLKTHINPSYCFIIYSPAKRTQQTADHIGDYFAINHTKKMPEHAIYEANLSTLLLLLEQYTEQQSLLIVGHNPSISQLAEFLTKQSIHLAPSEAVQINVTQLNNNQVISKHSRF